MDLHEYARQDAAGLRELLANGHVTAAEVETAARQALEAVNTEVNGLALPLFSPALDHAEDGPFAGVPFLIKDSGPMAEGVPFSLGSRAIRGAVARYDTDLMTRFRAAGLVTLGLTTVPELVISFSTEAVKHGPTRNPWDLERGVGGSSGGAAALVAAGAVPVAHGNDGAGSIRIPASCCGLVGLKPSRGRTPCGPGMGELAFGMAYESGLTRTVRDAARYLDAIQGPGVGDKYTAPPPQHPYALFNITGRPAISLPLGQSGRACPSGCRSSPRTAGRTCCSASRPGWRAPPLAGPDPAGLRGKALRRRRGCRRGRDLSGARGGWVVTCVPGVS
ncbi:MAG: amidase family protein [Actinoallomurus sp.]